LSSLSRWFSSLGGATRWAMTGLVCAACASGGSSAGDDSSAPSAACASCHMAEFQAVTHPPHPGAKPTTCATCHDQSSWHPSRLAHSFPLTGAHATADCFECHHRPTPVFEGTTQLCVGCHAQDQATANAHVARHATFPSQCQSCHGTTAWKPTLPHEQSELAMPPAQPAQQKSAATRLAEPPPPPAAPRNTPTHTPPASPKPSKPASPDVLSGASRVKGKSW
jgi:hypothetical protein